MSIEENPARVLNEDPEPEITVDEIMTHVNQVYAAQTPAVGGNPFASYLDTVRDEAINSSMVVSMDYGAMESRIMGQMAVPTAEEVAQHAHTNDRFRGLSESLRMREAERELRDRRSQESFYRGANYRISPEWNVWDETTAVPTPEPFTRYSPVPNNNDAEAGHKVHLTTRDGYKKMIRLTGDIGAAIIVPEPIRGASATGGLLNPTINRREFQVTRKATYQDMRSGERTYEYWAVER